MKKSQLAAVVRKSSLLPWIALIAVLFAAHAHAAKVKMLLMGDTQWTLFSDMGLSDPNNGYFIPTMQRLLTDNVTKDAAFVLGMGDIAENTGDYNLQYSIARTGWHLLDGKIPYVLNLGNNDSATEFIKKFPLADYSSLPSFVSNYDDHRNVAHEFNAGGLAWLVVSIRYYNPMNAAALTWAENLIAGHPNHKVIVVNHDMSGAVETMAKKYANVVFLLCGHTESSVKTVTGNNGNKIGWIKTCWHAPRLDAFLCVVEMDTVAGTAYCYYYSPYDGKYGHDASSELSKSSKHPTYTNPWTWSGLNFGVLPNNAQYVSQNVPSTLVPGETAAVSVTMKNTGSDPWNSANGQRLGSQPGGDFTWEFNRVDLPHDVANDQQVTFTFNITAPTTAGTYNFQWRMVDDLPPNQQWFGAVTPIVVIDVSHPTSNKVKNPSFEDGAAAPSSWNTTAAYSRTSEDSTDGGFSLKGTGTGELGSASQTIALTPDTVYNLSAKIMFVSGGTGIMVFDTNDKFDNQGNQFTLNSPNGGWQLYQGTFNSGSNTSVTLRTYTTSTFNGTFYVDEVTLVSAVAPASSNPTLTLTRNGPNLDFTWNSRAGKLYNLRSSPDLSGTPATWTVVAGNITATPSLNTKSILQPAAPTMFYVVEEY